MFMRVRLTSALVSVRPLVRPLREIQRSELAGRLKVWPSKRKRRCRNRPSAGNGPLALSVPVQLAPLSMQSYVCLDLGIPIFATVQRSLMGIRTDRRRYQFNPK